MWISDEMKKAMGFQAIPEGEILEAAFHSIHLFEMRGFTLDHEICVVKKGSTHKASYDLGLGMSVNQVCTSIIGQPIIEDEPEFIADLKCTPPFCVVHFGPTRVHKASIGYIKCSDTEITSYNLFAAAAREVRLLEEELANVETAMILAFSSPNNYARFTPITRFVFGIAPDKKTVHDILLKASGEGYVSLPLSATGAEERLTETTRMAAALDANHAYLFQRALRDEDPLKKFLFFFLSIEVEVNRAFGTRTKQSHVTCGATFERRISESLSELICNQSNFRNLSDKFIWCVASLWTKLNDADIKEFKRLKRVRDSIAHGSIVEPQATDLAAVELMAKSIAECSSRNSNQIHS
jgi:hypothetical protein